eukprot:364948-Chlamydomonas_euryale.AAC.11
MPQDFDVFAGPYIKKVGGLRHNEYARPRPSPSLPIFPLAPLPCCVARPTSSGASTHPRSHARRCWTAQRSPFSPLPRRRVSSRFLSLATHGSVSLPATTGVYPCQPPRECIPASLDDCPWRWHLGAGQAGRWVDV